MFHPSQFQPKLIAELLVWFEKCAHVSCFRSAEQIAVSLCALTSFVTPFTRQQVKQFVMLARSLFVTSTAIRVATTCILCANCHLISDNLLKYGLTVDMLYVVSTFKKSSLCFRRVGVKCSSCEELKIICEGDCVCSFDQALFFSHVKLPATLSVVDNTLRVPLITHEFMTIFSLFVAFVIKSEIFFFVKHTHFFTPVLLITFHTV